MQSKTGDRLAMSRALGAAFLNHQVEQLEKSVVNRGPNSGNWRDRRSPPGERNAKTIADTVPPRGVPSAKRAGATPNTRSPKKKVDDKPKDGAREAAKDRIAEPKHKRRNAEATKDADVVIIDASVLIHALGQLKKWCRAERKEVVVVPLEALNTLDLLKKGTSTLSQRARAASRVLEAQVGTNSRICVQRDDAFISWEDISFKNTPAPNPLMGTPEWLRRTISCARWEAEQQPQNQVVNPSDGPEADNKRPQKKVVFAVIAQISQPLPTDETIDESAATSPVPLPTPHANKFEPRTTGTLVAYWATRAGVELYEVQPAFTDASEPANGRKSDEDDGAIRIKKHYPAHVPSGRRAADRHVVGPTAAAGRGPGLVERPPAVKAMMEMVSQPSRVVRVLARGEKLDPDT